MKNNNNNNNSDKKSLDPSGNAIMTQAHDPDRHAAYFWPSPMSLVQLYIPAESVMEVAAELGDIGLIQFRDVRIRWLTFLFS